MKYIVITSPSFLPEEAAVITALFSAGLDILHFRKPGATLAQAECLLAELPEEFHSRIVIHDAFELKEKYHLRGIHLNSRHPVAPDGYQGQLSRSCHSLEEVRQTMSSFDYVFLSPVYDSISKEGYQSGYTRKVLEEACKEGVINEKVIALGGICEKNLPEVRSYGFGGVAFLGDIWNRYHAPGDIEVVITHFRKLLK